MPVLTCRDRFSISPQEIYRFLLATRENCLQSHCSRIISISLEIAPVDPLVVLQQIAQPKQLSFYWENQSKGEAIAAIDAVAKLELSGKQRFDCIQKFIEACRVNTTHLGELNSSLVGPHFFCSFSFFDEITQLDYPFPAATVFLPRWQVVRQGNRCLLVANLQIELGDNLEVILRELCQDIQTITTVKYSSHPDISRRIITKNLAGDDFKHAVVVALEAIKSNSLQKIVLAQALDVNSAAPLNLFQSLNNLRKLHPECYIFAISNGKGQNFVGASPERLISIHQQQLLTDALAGSAPRGTTAAADANFAQRLIRSEKERREHRVVIDFITQNLYQLGIVPQLLPSQLRRLSNIQHLWTPIQARVPDNVHPLEIVAQLHPTPAVAGVGRDVACTMIRQFESFERGLYAAPLGWIDYQGNSEFIVGIRSALIDGDRARLYAGAGIVAGSNPEKELGEIQLKLQALLKALE